MVYGTKRYTSSCRDTPHAGRHGTNVSLLIEYNTKPKFEMHFLPVQTRRLLLTGIVHLKKMTWELEETGKKSTRTMSTVDNTDRGDAEKESMPKSGCIHDCCRVKGTRTIRRSLKICSTHKEQKKICTKLQVKG